jgi:hypothetical protein
VTFDPSRPNTSPSTGSTPPGPEPGAQLPAAQLPPEPGPYGSSAAFPVSPVAPIAPAPKRKRSGRWLNVLLGLAVLFAVGGVAFAAGRTTAPASAAAASTGAGGARQGNGGQFPTGSGRPAFGGGNGGNGANGGFRGGLGAGGQISISGTVESITADTLTLKTASGQTVQFKLDPSTTYGTEQAATASEVTTGSKVQVGLALGAGGGGFGAGQRPQASGATSPVTGTAGSVTVVP